MNVVLCQRQLFEDFCNNLLHPCWPNDRQQAFQLHLSRQLSSNSRHVVEEGGEWRQCMRAQAAELGHQVLPQPAVHQGHGQSVLCRAQQSAVVGALQVQPHV